MSPPGGDALPGNSALGRAVRGLRKARRLTIEDLAFAAGMHPTYLSGIERGVRNPTWGKVRSLARALGLSVVEVIENAESEARIQEVLERVLAQERLGGRSP